MQPSYSAEPGVVFLALQRAISASGCTVQGIDQRTMTVFFKRGRKRYSASVRTGPAGTYVVGFAHPLLAAEIERASRPSQPPPAAAPDLATELERLGELRERALLTEDEFMAAKSRAFERAGGPQPTEQPQAAPAPPAPSEPSHAAAQHQVPPSAPAPTEPPAPQSITEPQSGPGAWLAAWHRLSRRRQIVVGAVVVILALAGVGALLPDDSAEERSAIATSTDDEEDTTTPPPFTGTGVGPEVRAWAADASEWADQLGEAFSTLSSLLQDEGFAARLLLGDQDAVLEVASPLAVMQQCTNSFPDPPSGSAQARNVTRLVHRACAQYERSATQFARGVDTLNTDLIESASASMVRGAELMNQATQETRVLLE